jgi:hypothetical protein
VILPDEKTIIGVIYKGNHNVMGSEDITNLSAVFTFGSGGNYIRTILPSKDFKSIFVGDDGGNLRQYDLKKSLNKWTHVKNHGNIGINNIYSSTCFGNLAIFGGGNSHVRVLDMEKKQMFVKPFKTAITYLDSLQMCQVSDSKVLLTVVGSSLNYSNSESDVFDITKLLAFHNVKYVSETEKHKESDDDSEIEENEIVPKDSINDDFNNFKHILELVFEKVHKLVWKMVNEKFQKLEEKILKSREIENRIKNKEEQEIVEISESEIKKKLVEIIKKYKADFMGKYI